MARLISLVEDASPLLREVPSGWPRTPATPQIIGITGSPGVGKSTSTAALVTRAARSAASGSACSRSTRRRRSPAARCSATGSGCRTTPPTREVYIRSMATPRPPRRARLGDPAGAAGARRGRLRRGADRDGRRRPVRGRGRRAGRHDLVLLAPGMGDGIQAAKAGILEVGDVFVVNKADRDGADQVVRDLRSVLEPRRRRTAPGDHRSSRPWRRPAQGIDDLVEAIERHREHLDATRRARPAPAAPRPRRDRGDRGDRPARAVRRPARARRPRTPRRARGPGTLDPYAAADRLLDAL